MAEHLLSDTDVHALLDQQRRGGMPGVMDPGISHFGLPENHLPGPPVLGTFDRLALPCGEDQIMIPPGVSRRQPLDCLPIAMLLEQIQDRGRALERELAFALALPKDDAPVSPLRALVSVSKAIHGARTLITNVALPRAARFTSRTVPVLLTALLAGSPVPPFAAGMRSVTAMPPGDALNLKPGSYQTGLQVHIRPSETKGFTLPNAKSKSDRPSRRRR
jgi:hypothetical protein